MSSSSSQREPLDRLAEQFVEQLRLGQTPSVDQYARDHPDLSERIRRLFPKLVLMERAAPAGDDRDASSDGRLNRQLGDFRLLRELGRGGMGIVYEAVQQSLGRRVALKVLAGNSLNMERRRQRFQREAQAAARLHHTNIVPVYGVGQHEDVCYYVMQYINGYGLHVVLCELDRLRKSPRMLEPTAARGASDCDAASASSVAQSLLAGRFHPQSTTNPASDADHIGRPVPPTSSSTSGGGGNWRYWQAVARIGVQIAEALHYAHDQGVFHRDIKPENILLDANGTVWVADFGLAKVVESDDLTRDGDVVGTLRYMAPEQFESKCDARSDIYSLGLTLYEFLTFRPAFEEPHAAARLRTAPMRLRKVIADIPGDLETIVLKAIDPEPNHRYQSAVELAEDLRRFLEDRPIAARRVSALEHSWRWCRRNPVIAGLAATVAFLLVAVAATSATLAIRFQSEKQLAIQNAKLSEENSLRALESAFAGSRKLHSGRYPGHRLEGLSAIAEAARLLPKVALPPERKEKIHRQLRDEAIAALTTVDARLHEDWSYGAEPIGLIRAGFDSQVERYARQESDGPIVVRRFADNAELARFGKFDVEQELRVYVTFSPDDRLVAVRGPVDGALKVCVWRIADGELLLETTAAGRSYHSSVDFSPDSQALAVHVADNRVDVFRLEDGAPIHKLPVRRAPYFVRYSPDGRRLALGDGPGQGRSGNVLIVDLEPPNRELLLPHPDFVPDSTWSRDSRLLATPCYDYNIRVWDVESGIVHTNCQGHRGKPRHVAFHPTHDLLMSTSWDSTTRIWNPHTGQELLRCTDRGVAFSRDGVWLGSEQPASIGVRRWRIATADACRTLYGHDRDAYVVTLAFSPDGSVLASGSDNDGVRLWDVRRGRQLTHLVREYSIGVGFPGNQWELWTSSRSGLRSWPIQIDRKGPNRTLRCGPPTLLELKNPRRLSYGGDAVLVASTGTHARLYRDEKLQDIGPLAGPASGNTKFAAVSPNGAWAATSGKRAPGVTVWNLDAQEPVCELPVGPARLAFSPDGKQLVTSAFQQNTFWETGSWRELRRESHDGAGFGPVAFSPDMELLASAASHRVILHDASSGIELATLAAPNPELLATAHPEGSAALCFSPDSRYLAVGEQGGKIRIWDIHSIRRSLAEIGLDWAQTPLPPASVDVDGALSVEIIGTSE